MNRDLGGRRPELRLRLCKGCRLPGEVPRDDKHEDLHRGLVSLRLLPDVGDDVFSTL